MSRKIEQDLGKFSARPYRLEVIVRNFKTFGRFPHSDAIVGVRLVDKSFSGKENFRMEVWVKYDNESSEVANQIKEFIAEHYNTENAQPQAVSFRSHK